MRSTSSAAGRSNVLTTCTMVPPRVRNLCSAPDSRPCHAREFQIFGLPHRISLWLVLRIAQSFYGRAWSDGIWTGQAIEMPPFLPDDFQQYFVDCERGVGQSNV